MTIERKEKLFPECEQCGQRGFLYSMVLEVRGRRVGQMWVCADCRRRLVEGWEQPVVTARLPKSAGGQR